MMKLLLLTFLVMMTYIVLHRQRVFVRDPLATVYKSAPLSPEERAKLQSNNAAASDNTPGEVKLTDVQVYINYSNDVLLVRDAQPAPFTLLVQHWNRTPGKPQVIKCIHSMACLTDADQATMLPVVPTGSGTDIPNANMSDQSVSFTAGDGTRMRVTLR